MLKLCFKQMQVKCIHVSTVIIESFDTKSLINEAVKAIKSYNLASNIAILPSFKYRYSIKLKQAENFIFHTCIW